jgi:predicted glycoside hydrolase/deacetylase ChbG (UPF0249 family)
MRRWRAGEVAAEVAAQFDRFVDMAGTAPDHLDSHHFVANYSTACLDAVLALSDQYDLPIRKTDHTLLEIMVDRPAYVGAGRNLLATLLMPLFRSQVTVYRRHPRPRTTDRLEASFYGRGASLKRLLRILARLPDGLTEIMCHPGVTARSQGKGPGQDGELAILTHDDVEAMISQKGIQLISYAALGD